MAQQGQEQGAGMSNEEFGSLCYKAGEGKTAEVLAAVDQDRRLATRASDGGATLLIYACLCSHDNPQLAQGLLERGANVHAWDSGSWDALMYASRNGYLAVCTVLLDRGADPDSRTQYVSALSLAARYDNLQVCLLLISRRANLMLALIGGTALDRYGEHKYPRLTADELEQRRAIVLTAFEQGPHPDMCWKRRWPFVCVLVGCDFQPLAARKAHLLLINPPLPPDALIPPVPIGTPELYRAYLHGCIFAHPGFWKLIAAFL
jgi:Ankyrin repeats (3 copies)